MRIRTAKLDELQAKKPREKQMSPRQQAATEREENVRRALQRLRSDGDVVALELDPAEKIPTMRATVKKVIAEKPGTNVAIRGRTIYLSTSKLPGARGGRKPASA